MPSTFKIGNRHFDFFKEIGVMGILNITPDSFSDGGLFLDPQAALDQAQRMIDEGADLIDVGAESTRPGARSLSIQEEMARLQGVFKILIQHLKIPLSIDTRKAAVARWALQEGAAMVNDVSAFRFDEEMITVLKEKNSPFILMHSRGNPETMSDQNQYDAFNEEMLSYFDEKLTRLEEFGISRERILLDPGIGFAKVGNQNLEILRHLDDLKRFGRPLVMGLSRKSFLEEYFGPTSHPRERGVGTEVAHSLAILKGANILRVHDVKAARKTIRWMQAFMEV